MEEVLKELQKFIDNNSKNYNIEFNLKDWRSLGEAGVEEFKPIFDLKLTEKVLI